MQVKILLAAALAMGMSAPLLAKDESNASGGATTKEKKVCRTENITGSLIGKRRVCLTQAEWDKVAAETKKNLDEYGSRMGGIREGAGQAG
jgi:hypothetical protein|uniref:hypothetical protein n=1 Tax=Altererythrobacter segetis TaxID=1104773 RepID=UPI00140B9C66|nr:hypothetical protein [Altererythrobacter segetis]